MQGPPAKTIEKIIAADSALLENGAIPKTGPSVIMMIVAPTLITASAAVTDVAGSRERELIVNVLLSQGIPFNAVSIIINSFNKPATPAYVSPMQTNKIHAPMGSMAHPTIEISPVRIAKIPSFNIVLAHYPPTIPRA
jgi:hypothetical protein